MRIYDFAWMVALVGIITIVFGLGIQSANTYGNKTYDTSFFDNVSSDSQSSLKTASDEQESIIQGVEGSGDTLTSDGYLLGGLKSLFSLAGTWKSAFDSMGIAAANMGVPAGIITLIAAAMLITFAAILYTWFRGS